MATATGAKKSLIGLGGLAAAAAAFFAINIASQQGLSSARIDLTEEGLYTLSDGTLSLLQRIEEPVTLRLYYSDRLGEEVPAYGTYATRVRDMLSEYAARSNGNLSFEIYNPEPFSDEEDRAVAFGLQGVPVNQSGEQVYFGLAGTNAVDTLQTIPFFSAERENFLEYDLTRLVDALANPRRPVVGIVTTLPINGAAVAGAFGAPQMQSEPWIIAEQLQQAFDVRYLPAEMDAIDADIGILLVIHPKTLSDRSLYAIDQYVLRGGHAMIFVDPHSEAEASRPQPGQPPGETYSDLKPLFDAWGLAYDSGRIIGDLNLARRVQATSGSSLTAVDYVAWLNLRAAQFNADDVITADLEALNMASAGWFATTEAMTGTWEPLLRTSDATQEIDALSVRFEPNPEALLAEFQASGEPHILAGRLTGTLKSAFPDGIPAATDGSADGVPATDTAGTTHLAESAAPANVILVADTDLLSDRFWVRVQDFFGQRLLIPNADNGDFILTAVENLAGSGDLITLRSRGVSVRPFTRIEAMQRAAERDYRATEKQLQDELKAVEAKLAELQQPSDAGNAIVTPEQEQAIENFRQEVLRIRKELRSVQLELRRDIDALEGQVRFANIGLIPALILVLAVLIGFVRSARRVRRAA